MDTREQIISASEKIFLAQGFHATGVDLLAQHAGTTKRTLYSHFSNKDGLIAAVLDYRHDSFYGSLKAALEAVPPAESAAAYLGFLQNWIASPDFGGCLFANACAEYADAESPPHLKAAAHKQAVRDLLRERFQAAGFAAAEAMAELLFVGGEGLIVSAQVCGNEQTAAAAALLEEAVMRLAKAA